MSSNKSSDIGRAEIIISSQLKQYGVNIDFLETLDGKDSKFKSGRVSELNETLTLLSDKLGNFLDMGFTLRNFTSIMRKASASSFSMFFNKLPILQDIMDATQFSPANISSILARRGSKAIQVIDALATNIEHIKAKIKEGYKPGNIATYLHLKDNNGIKSALESMDTKIKKDPRQQEMSLLHTVSKDSRHTKSKVQTNGKHESAAKRSMNYDDELTTAVPQTLIDLGFKQETITAICGASCSATKTGVIKALDSHRVQLAELIKLGIDIESITLMIFRAGNDFIRSIDVLATNSGELIKLLEKGYKAQHISAKLCITKGSMEEKIAVLIRSTEDVGAQWPKISQIVTV